MDVSHRVWVGCFVAFSIALSADAVAETREARDVSQIQIDGLRTISAKSIRKRLKNQPEVFEATHRTIDQATFAFRVHEAVERGMLASGFLDAHVTLASEQPVRLVIDEGRRFRNGSVHVHGASEAANAWIADQITTASTTEKDADPAWELGKPTVGTLFGSMAKLQTVRERLNELGLNGSKALVQTERHEETTEQALTIQLDPSDESFTVPSPDSPNPESLATETSPDIVDKAEATGQTNASIRPANGIAAELHAIHQRWFAQPTNGIRVRHEDEESSIDLWCGDEAAVAIVTEGDQKRSIVYNAGELQFGMDDSLAAIRVPVPNASLTVKQSAVSEVDDNKTMSMTFGGKASSDKTGGSTTFGMTFTDAAWIEWFPPEQTKRTESETARIYVHQDHVLKVDLEGNLIQLRGLDPAERMFVIDRVDEKQIQAFADQTTAGVVPIQLFVHDPTSDKRISLKTLWDDYEEDRTNQDEFNIPPAGGQRDVFGVVILAAVHDGRLVNEHSLIGKIAQLYALELSRNRRTLVDRLAEIEAEAMKGAVTSAVLGDLVKRQGNGGIEIALRYFRHSQSLMAMPSAAEHDVKALLDPSNLIGRVVQQVDVKQWLQVTVQWAEPWADEQLVGVVNGFVTLLPDATNEEERLENARSVVKTAYELAGRANLEQYLIQNIAELEARQQRLAKKKESKKEKKR